ncbi:MAG TPA: heme lyase CcmF/NrfE family subunit [Candidatus Aquabacterium excrementipullorum]|nr:heme lyase CcmF/NrfE family subunit [Candidatus Aquabacterium excrementipullorum]
MTPELGNFALMLALGLAVVQSVLPLLGAWRGDARWMGVARPAAAGQFVFVALAFGCLVQAFVGNDFSVAYVASNSNTTLPVYYRVAATWGGHEGSLLLWVLILTGWTFAVSLFSRQLPEETVSRVLGVLGLVSIGFLSFMLLTSNPFDRQLPAAADGRDLNPLLQDLGMIVHPPLLYMGYVGFGVAFAFAVAALLAGRLDAAWARWSRPWTLVAWAFLTLGIFMGSFWAYYELGWGGWWFWDPVENASFMPWLVGTALIHSLAVTEKRGSFKNWTVLLAILAFSLSLLGTFLVRSGVLTSVHAFAADPRRGLYILVFLAVVIGGSLSLYAWRAPSVGPGGRFALFSRESLLLVNNVLLLVAAATVLLGTLYPLVLDALNLGKISVGPPYFDSVFMPLMLPLLLLIPVGPFVGWKQGVVGKVLRRLRTVAVVSLVLGGLIALIIKASPLVLLGLVLAAWIVLSTGLQLWDRLQLLPAGTSWLRRLRSPELGYWGMLVAHLGVGIFVVGVTLSRGLGTAEDVHLRVGDSAQAGPYRLSFTALDEVRGPNYVGARGTFEVQQGSTQLPALHPEKRIYTVQRMPMTEAAIDRGLTRDLYVSLGEATPDGAWLVRVQHKPFMAWVWGGAVVIGLGGFLAASDRRYRLRRRAASSAAGQAAPPVGHRPDPAVKVA